VAFTNAFELVYAVVDPANTVCEADKANNIRMVSVMTSLDSDSDGLLDGEEARWGTNPSVWDSDGDGISDGAEVHTYGTNPLLADGLRLDTPALLNGGEFALTISDVCGRDVVVQVSSNLVTWVALTNFSSVEGPIYFVDPTTPRPPSKFYRAIVGR
jgi:hypothetical protein